MRDEAVIRAIVSRDEAVMDRVINKYSRLLWPIASAILSRAGNEQDVEECVADAFIYLWQNPERFDPGRGTLKSLLCVIVRSRAIDRYREIMRRDTVPMEEAVLSAGREMQEELLREETRRELLAAVNVLEEPNREILIRRYYHDQKPREIAIAMGLTVKQVDNSLFRSKRHLREVLTAEGDNR
ncbi:MAG: sigma-70 family RNA polymerase sigma factor [Oscillospiraceae bacterium]|nr:sigma-70 family RNA polymerase sigma factor [Oscillospiraceae bacterium]MBQ7129650.1 sigma-70 family RNA polymerase sigma factor [Oscillospiraceae bacterium]